MKKYIIEMSETAEQDLENIISYLKYDLAGDIIADKYKLLFKQELKKLEDVAGSMPVKSGTCIYELGKIFKRWIISLTYHG